MRVLVQRVTSSSVEVEGKIVGKIDNGIMLLVGFTHTDTSKEIDYMVDKVINLRIFDDENGRPFVNILKKDLIIEDIDISISHCKTYAVASVVVCY